MTRRTMPRRLALSLAVGTFVVGACGGAPGGPNPSTGPQGTGTPATAPASIGRACDILTDADIQEITGTTVVSKTDNVADTVYANRCRWTLQREDGGNGTFDLGILSPGGRERYDRSGGNSGLQPLDGLPADDAGVDPNVGGIFAVRGDTLIDVYTLSLLLSTEQEAELAKRVLERIFGSGGPGATAGTGGQPTQSTGGTASDPCALLTDEEILEVTGSPAVGKEGTRRGGMWDAACVWQVQSGGMVPATLTVTIKSPGGRAIWDQYMVPIQAEFTPVADLGDAAFAKVLWPTHVLAGDTYVSVQFSGGTDPEGPATTELARRVVEKLGS